MLILVGRWCAARNKIPGFRGSGGRGLSAWEKLCCLRRYAAAAAGCGESVTPSPFRCLGVLHGRWARRRSLMKHHRAKDLPARASRSDFSQWRCGVSRATTRVGFMRLRVRRAALYELPARWRNFGRLSGPMASAEDACRLRQRILRPTVTDFFHRSLCDASRCCRS